MSQSISVSNRPRCNRHILVMSPEPKRTSAFGQRGLTRQALHRDNRRDEARADNEVFLEALLDELCDLAEN